MKIGEALESLMYIRDNVMMDSEEEKAIDMAIRSLEAWENLEVDMFAPMGKTTLCGYTEHYINDVITGIERDDSE